MKGDCCKTCDGRGNTRNKNDYDEIVERRCSRCNGSGREPGPGKGKRPFFSKTEDELSPEEMSIEQQTRAFLRKHGY